MNDQLALFNQYDSEYCSKATDVARKTQQVATLSGDAKRTKARELEGDLKEADQIAKLGAQQNTRQVVYHADKQIEVIATLTHQRLAQVKRMEMEARSFSQERARDLLIKVREYKADLARLREGFKEAAAGAGAGGAAGARAELGLGAGADYGAGASSGQRERVLASGERLARTGERLTQGQQQLLETEELGVSILEDLHRQRQTIGHTRDTLHGADDNVARARRILASMSRRLTTNKLILAGIVLLLVAAIGIVIYYKFHHSS